MKTVSQYLVDLIFFLESTQISWNGPVQQNVCSLCPYYYKAMNIWMKTILFSFSIREICIFILVTTTLEMNCLSEGQSDIHYMIKFSHTLDMFMAIKMGRNGVNYISQDHHMYTYNCVLWQHLYIDKISLTSETYLSQLTMYTLWYTGLSTDCIT